jgi:LacI family repressor for deo operon, udp, cdd, tsx, nupC, and nupG
MIKASSNMRDVAQEAGVSITTVSRVLQDNAIPTEETRRRVLEVVERLGYTPRRRRNKKTAADAKTPQTVKAIAFLTAVDVAADVHGDFDQYGKLINSLHRWFDAAGYRLYYARWDCQNEPAPDVLDDPQTVGAVVMGRLPPEVAEPLGRRLPLVGLDHGSNLNVPGDLALCSITDAMNSSLRYLMGLGHRRIVFFGNERYGDHYMETFLAESSRLGLKMDPALRGLCRPNTIGDENYNQVLEEYVWAMMALGRDRPTAVILRYRFAIGLVDWAQRGGWSIPQDLSVVGIVDRLLNYTHPPITAYDWPMEELGRSAAELLMSRIQEPTRPYRTLAVRGRMIERASCGACPSVMSGTVTRTGGQI